MGGIPDQRVGSYMYPVQPVCGRHYACAKGGALPETGSSKEACNRLGRLRSTQGGDKMGKKLACIHTSCFIVGELKALMKSCLRPETEVTNVCDDGLLRDVLKAGGLTPGVVRRVCQYAIAAEESGSDAIMIGCSSINLIPQLIQPLLRVPVFSIDEAMAERAVQLGRRIGLVATVPTTVAPSTRLIQEKARVMGKEVTITPTLVEAAFSYLQDGQRDRHDQVIYEKIKTLQEHVDIVVMAQVSMSRMEEFLRERVAVPVLTSGKSGFMRAQEILDGVSSPR